MPPKKLSKSSTAADPEYPDEYRTINIFRMSSETRWAFFKEYAKQPNIYKAIASNLQELGYGR
jgi:hypothetical protein